MSFFNFKLFFEIKKNIFNVFNKGNMTGSGEMSAEQMQQMMMMMGGGAGGGAPQPTPPDY